MTMSNNNIINFCTLNVNGLQMKDKQRRLLQWIKNQNCSIVFLQETHFNNESKCLVKRLLSTETSNWKVIPRNYLDKVGKNWLIFKMNIDNGKSIKKINDILEFYKEIINCWVEFGGGQTKIPTNFREIRNQNI
jgi:hypothetical protein